MLLIYRKVMKELKSKLSVRAEYSNLKVYITYSDSNSIKNFIKDRVFSPVLVGH